MHPTYLTHSPSIYLLCQISCALETDPEYMYIYIYSVKVIYIYICICIWEVINILRHSSSFQHRNSISYYVDTWGILGYMEPNGTLMTRVG